MRAALVLITALAVVVAGVCGWGWQRSESELARLRASLDNARTIERVIDGDTVILLRASLDNARTIERVIDGDTVILDGGERVRLYGYDAPELREKVNGRWRKIKDPDPRGVAAYEYLKRLEGRKVRLHKKATDVYGRTVGELILLPDEVDLSEEIKRHGWHARLIDGIGDGDGDSDSDGESNSARDGVAGLYRFDCIRTRLRGYICGYNRWFSGALCLDGAFSMQA